jgi:hypothetical protein
LNASVFGGEAMGGVASMISPSGAKTTTVQVGIHFLIA